MYAVKGKFSRGALKTSLSQKPVGQKVTDKEKLSTVPGEKGYV